LYARLGPRFLRRHHAGYLRSAGAVALLAERDGRPVGFLTGVVTPAAHRIALKRAVPALTVIGTAALLNARVGEACAGANAGSYPRRVRRILRRNQPDSQPNCPTGVLTYLAVSPEARGQAVGDTLLGVFLGQAQTSGCRAVTLTTEQGARGAESYYAARGWTKAALHQTRLGSATSSASDQQ
jgi:GNAT superfamily N-acetyltransferase